MRCIVHQPCIRYYSDQFISATTILFSAYYQTHYHTILNINQLFNLFVKNL